MTPAAPGFLSSLKAGWKRSPLPNHIAYASVALSVALGDRLWAAGPRVCLQMCVLKVCR
jgi:hypothetical protein